MIRSDHILARTLAKTAGDLLLDLRQQLTDHSGRDRGRAGDLAAHRMLLQQIAAELDSASSGSGSSIRWTERGNTVRPIATTGQYTLRCGSGAIS
jgi:hypothetical protein